MGKKRVLVGYGIDVDAVSNHINTTVGGKANLCNVSRGKYSQFVSALRLEIALRDHHTSDFTNR
jgi:hypothetical protein